MESSVLEATAHFMRMLVYFGIAFVLTLAAFYVMKGVLQPLCLPLYDEILEGATRFLDKEKVITVGEGLFLVAAAIVSGATILAVALVVANLATPLG